jgi:antitoxin component YwqK of YwqJK toxin-antitoxin module
LAVKIVTRALFSRSERKGEWQEFYESGRLKAVGRYKGIHETHHVAWPKPSGLGGPGVFTPGDLSEEHLKDELWKYYDEQGRQVKEEYYYKGMMVSEETWEY